MVEKKKINDYIEVALYLPVESRKQIESMVILYFDIPDGDAKKLVDKALINLRREAEHLLHLLDRLY